MKDITRPEYKEEKRKLRKEDIIGFAFGILLPRVIGFSGFIPYVIGISFGIWFTEKMLNSKKRYTKIIFFILFVVIFLLAVLAYTM